MDERIPNEDRKEISVLGLCRGRRYYVDEVPVDLIENVRLSCVDEVKRINAAIEYPFIKDDKKDDDEWFFE